MHLPKLINNIGLNPAITYVCTHITITFGFKHTLGYNFFLELLPFGYEHVLSLFAPINNITALLVPPEYCTQKNGNANRTHCPKGRDINKIWRPTRLNECSILPDWDNMHLIQLAGRA